MDRRIVLPLLAVAVFGLATEARAAGANEPPPCAAITFRPLPPGRPDGEHESGLYRSRFGKLELRTTVKGGQARNYFIHLNGKPPKVHAGALPNGADACVKSKKMPPPGKAPAPTCVGDRFTVVIARQSKPAVALLYALDGRDWVYCGASQI